DGPQSYDFQFEGGISDMLEALVQQHRGGRVHPGAFTMSATDDASQSEIEVALAWTEEPRERLRSFVNAIPTQDGGTHEQGVRDGIVRSIRAWMETHDLIPRGVTITAEDIREGIKAVVSLFILEPQFQGQTKDKLNNSEVRSWVASA